MGHDLEAKTREALSGIFEDLVVNINLCMQSVNKKRNDFTSPQTIADDMQDHFWHFIRNYSKDKKLGCIPRPKKNRRRWVINGLIFGFNKVDEKLRLSTSPDYFDNGQLSFDIASMFNPVPAIPFEISDEYPLRIAYMPSADRKFIKEIHIIHYNKDGSINWNIELYKHKAVEAIKPVKELRHKVNNVKIKSPEKKVINMFKDKNNNE
jgi:hypothetical protein